MSNKQNAPGSAATLTGAENEDAVQAVIPQEENNTAAAARQVGRIEAMLLRGEKFRRHQVTALSCVCFSAKQSKEKRAQQREK